MSTWLLIFIGLSAWALVTPYWSDIDSNSHIPKAYAVAHGDIFRLTPAPAKDGLGTSTIVQYPTGFARSLHRSLCYVRRPAANASCGQAPTDDYVPISVPTQAGRYNPLYYFVVGFPSLFLRPDLALYAMRLISAAFVSLLLAWAVAAARLTRRPGISLAALALTVTPELAYLGGCVNPNTVEICGLIAAVSCGLATLTPTLTGTDRASLFRRCLLGLSAAVVTRSISPVWVAAGVLILIAAGGLPLIRAAFQPPHRKWVFFGIGATVLSVAWTLLSGVVAFRPPRAHLGLLTRIGLAAAHQWKTMAQQVGNLGWLEFPVPTVLVLLYIVAVVIPVVLALFFATAWQRLLVVAVIAASFLLPVLLEALQWNGNGPIWQGRYTLPLSVQILLVSAFCLSSSRRLGLFGERWTALLLSGSMVLYMLVQIITFGLWTHRNVAGTRTPFSLNGPWMPPISGTMLVLTWSAMVLTFGTLAITHLWRPQILDLPGPLRPEPDRADVAPSGSTRPPPRDA